MDRFKKIYSQGIVSVAEIWLDTLTGVQYLHLGSQTGGITPLLDRDGKPVIASETEDEKKR